MKNNILIEIAIDNLYIEKGSFVFSLFLDFESTNSKVNAQIPVIIILKLEKYESVIILNLFNIVNIAIAIITILAVGRDFEIIFLKNLPLTRSLLGSNANIKDGIPMVTTLIKVN